MRHRRKSFIFFLTIMLVGIYALTRSENSVVAAQDEGVNLSATECGQGASGLQFSYKPIDYEFVASDRLAFTLELTLMKAQRPQQYTALLFFDGVQVEAEGDVLDVDCGETMTAVYEAQFNPESRPNVVHFVVRELPIITSKVKSLDVNDANIEAFTFLSDVSDRGAIQTLHIGEPLPFNPSKFENVQAEKYRENDLVDHYLYTTSVEQPVSVAVLGEGQDEFDFNVRYQNLFRDSDPFTVTCLLDDVQQKVFNNNRTYAAPKRCG